MMGVMVLSYVVFTVSSYDGCYSVKLWWYAMVLNYGGYYRVKLLCTLLHGIMVGVTVLSYDQCYGVKLWLVYIDKLWRVLWC